MNTLVTFLGPKRMPFVFRWKHETVSPICIMWHDATTRGTADQRTQQCCAFNVRIFLEIAECGRRFRPAVKPQHWFANMN